MRLGQEQIHETPPQAGRAFDQLQIFRAKNHRPQRAQIIAQLPHRLAVQRQFAFRRRPIHLDLMAGLRHHAGADKVALLAVADHLRPAHAAKGAQGGQQVDGFEKLVLPWALSPSSK